MASNATIGQHGDPVLGVLAMYRWCSMINSTALHGNCNIVSRLLWHTRTRLTVDCSMQQTQHEACSTACSFNFRADSPLASNDSWLDTSTGNELSDLTTQPMHNAG